jgi:hypothetical protein
MKRRRTVRGLALAGATVAGLATGAGAAYAAQPIEGSWLFQNGEVLVEPTGAGTFKGTVVKPTRFIACTHPTGQVMWNIGGSGAAYTGTHVWYHSDCSVDPGGLSTWAITNTAPATFALRFCTVRPGGGPPTFDAAGTPTGGTSCNDLKRILPPQPTPTFDRVVSVPKATRACRSRRSLRIRLREPKADPLVRATVDVNRHRVRVVTGARLAAAVNLRGLPRGRYLVRIVVTTASGRNVQGYRSYRTCAHSRP